MRHPLAALLVALCSSSLYGQAPEGPSDPIPVAIVLTRDYPAFQPDTAGDGRRELRGLVILGAPNGSETRTILLNPKYVDEQVLWEAVSIVQRAPQPNDGRAGAVPIGLRPTRPLPQGQVADRLRGILAELRAPGAAESRWMMAEGSIVELPDILIFFREMR